MSSSTSFSIKHPIPPQSAEEALKTCGIPALRAVVVHEEQTLLILKGRLPSYYLKQLAQEAVMPFLGTRIMENRIVVVQH